MVAKLRILPRPKPTSLHSGNGGFTLIEFIIAVAISSSLLLIAFVGQSQLRDRSRFDAAINKVIQDIAYARNYATSNVSQYGTGNNRTPGATSQLAGASFEFDNNHPDHKLTELEPLYANTDASGNITHDNLPIVGNCPQMADNECFEEFFSSPDPLTLTNANEGEIAFLNTDAGIVVCGQLGGGWIGIDAMCSSANPSFGLPLQFTLRGETGLTATIQIDPHTGFAKRLN